MFQTLKLFYFIPHMSRGIHSFRFTMNKNSSKATHQHNFLVLMASCSLENPYKDEVTSCNYPTWPQSHTPMYTIYGLLGKKCNMMSFPQIIVWNPIMAYYIHDVYECPNHFHKISPKGDKSFLPFHIGPPFSQ